MTVSNGSNGARDAKGRFAKGNPGGPGNPHVTRLRQWREALEAELTPARLRRIYGKLVEAAEAGEPWAIREVLDRTLGRPAQADVLDRIDALERRLREQNS